MSPPRLSKLIHAVTLLALAACSADAPVTAPDHPTPPSRPELSRMAIRLIVDMVRGEVTVGSPTPSPRLGRGAGAVPSSGVGRPSFALLGKSEVDVTRSNVFISKVGEFLPGKVRVRFDLTLTNRLTGVALVTPTTFPRPPLGEQGLLLFPFAISQIEDPGAVAASTDWDLGPHNFFNDAVCAGGGPGSDDCYRYESYPSPLAAGATSEARTVGFDVDPQVRSFEVDVLLAADLQNAATPAPSEPGTVSGTVSSFARGLLGGVTVTVSPGGQSAVTGGGGAGRAGRAPFGSYRIQNVTPQPVTLMLSTLPDGCTAPEPLPVTVAAGQLTLVDFIVTCTPLGTIEGSVSSFAGLPGVTVTVSPSEQSTVTTVDRGSYVLRNVPPGQATVMLSTLPAGCIDPGSQTVTVTADQVTTVDFRVVCILPTTGVIAGQVSFPFHPQPVVTVTASSGQSAPTFPRDPGGSAVEAYHILLEGATIYVIPNVPAGQVTLTLTNLPGECIDPGPQTVTVTAGAVMTVDFRVACFPP